MKFEFTDKSLIVVDGNTVEDEEAFCIAITDIITDIIWTYKKTNPNYQNQLWFIHLFAGHNPLKWYTFTVPISHNTFKLPKDLSWDVFDLLHEVYLDNVKENWNNYIEDEIEADRLKATYEWYGITDNRWEDNSVVYKNYKKPIFLYINRFGLNPSLLKQS